VLRFFLALIEGRTPGGGGGGGGQASKHTACEISREVACSHRSLARPLPAPRPQDGAAREFGLSLLLVALRAGGRVLARAPAFAARAPEGVSAGWWRAVSVHTAWL